MRMIHCHFNLSYFNPRTPCGVRRCSANHQFHCHIFQSTHPLRGATAYVKQVFNEFIISIHAPLAGCDRTDVVSGTATLISIHAPLAGCDIHQILYISHSEKFQSTHPLRGATNIVTSYVALQNISIHAPLAGCDYYFIPFNYVSFNFNPRTPCGVRPNSGGGRGKIGRISIHAPLAGCD